MCESCQIKDGDYLIGASLGGMVACEITKFRKIPRLYLIGSAVCPFGKPAYLGDTSGGIFQGGSVLGIQIIKRVT